MSLLSTYRQASLPSFFYLLDQTIQTYGPLTWQRITQLELKKGDSDPDIIPLPSEFLDRFTSDLRRWREWRPGNLFGKAGAFLPLWSGFWISWLFPHTDLCFLERPQAARSIYLHRPLILFSRIWIAWLKEMFRLVQQHPNLQQQDRKIAQTLIAVLERFEKGFAEGVYRKDILIKLLRSIHFLKNRRKLSIKVDTSFLNWLETQIRTQ